MDEKEIIEKQEETEQQPVENIQPAEAPVKELAFDYNDPDYKRRKKKASIISICIVVSLIVAFALLMWVWFFIVNYPIITVTHKNIDDLKIDYTISEDGQYITNINYDDYLEYSPSIFDGLFSTKYYLSEEGAVEGKDAMVSNTALIQGIIDSVTSSTVIYVDGNYNITSIQLKDKVTIIIEKDCSLIGPEYSDHVNFDSTKGIIWAEDAKDIAIYGPGSIVGNGTTYTNEASDPTIFAPLSEFNVRDKVLEARKRIREAKDKNTRPHIVYLNNCSDVKIQNVRLHNAAFWTMCLKDSNDILVKDIVIDNNVHVANADGIDIQSSQKVKVVHCFIATADDGICIKSNGNENVEDISVDRCSVMSMANNFKIGTETSKDVEHIKVTNCYFFMPSNVAGGYAGISIESADGANVEDVYVDNIYMKGISSPLLIWLGDRLDKDKGSDGTMGSMKGITVSNITAYDVEMASAITGCKHQEQTYYVENVKVANFNIYYRNSGEKLDVGEADYEPSMSGYPEITRMLHKYILSHEKSVYKDMPVYGLFARHINGLKIYNLNVNARSCNTLSRDNVTQAKDRYDVLDVSVN